MLICNSVFAARVNLCYIRCYVCVVKHTHYVFTKTEICTCFSYVKTSAIDLIL